MSTLIKYNQGQEVFWLSSKGFKKGVIKTVRFSSDEYKTETTYLLACKDYPDVYMGDEVPEELIFTSYEDMFFYYQKSFTP